MLNWSESYNWTREEFDVTLRKAFVDEKKNVVSLDVEHSSASNIKALIRWARAAGYNAEETPGSEAVRVWKPDEKKDPAATTDRMAILEYAIVHGRQAAADLLLLFGPDNYLQGPANYDDLMYLLTDGKEGKPLES